MRIVNRKIYNESQTKLSFASINLNSIKHLGKKKLSYSKPTIEFKKKLSLQDIKNIILTKIFQYNNLEEDSNISNIIKRMFKYIKSLEQSLLASSILNNKFFHTEENISKIHGIVLATNTEAKNRFVAKIFNEESLYKNSSILNKIEPILYSSTSSEKLNSKNLVLDKILSSKALKNNNDFIKNAGTILYNIDDTKSTTILNNILDSILNNEMFAKDKNFIKILGEVLSLSDSPNNTYISEFVFQKYNHDKKKAYVLASIPFIKNYAASEVFSNILKSENLYNNEDFLKYLPELMLNINKNNLNKIDTIINYLNKNKNSEKYNLEIISEFLDTRFSSLLQVEEFLRVKQKFIEKDKEQINETTQSRNKSIEDFFYENKRKILSSLEILGEKNFVHSFSSKLIGLEQLCNDCNFIKENLNEEYYEKLLLKINPKSSKKYLDLEKKISKLKNLHLETQNSNNLEQLKNLQKEINIYTRQTREIVSKKLNYDPDTVIDRIRILASFIDKASEENINAQKYIDILQDSTAENDKTWKDFCYRRFFDKLEIDYDDNLTNKLNLINNKYFGKILLANQKFLSGLKEIILLIKNNPNKSIKEIFNDLPSNQITKIEFEKHGIDYDAWINFDNDSHVLIADTNIVIKKVNMNDISKSLFLGNEASCCTKVGTGSKQETAPKYIKNKLVSAIEIIDSGISVGNTMCYFAKVDGKTSLILDDIELLPDYRNNDSIRDGVFEYAKKLCAEVNKPNIPIYIEGHRNKVCLNGFPSSSNYILPIGNTGNDSIYFDFLSSYTKVDSRKKDYYKAELTRIY